MNDTLLMTVNEAAARIGCTISAVYMRVRGGDMEMTEKFGRILVYRRDVEKWRKERIATATKQLEGAGA